MGSGALALKPIKTGCPQAEIQPDGNFSGGAGPSNSANVVQAAGNVWQSVGNSGLLVRYPKSRTHNPVAPESKHPAGSQESAGAPETKPTRQLLRFPRIGTSPSECAKTALKTVRINWQVIQNSVEHKIDENFNAKNTVNNLLELLKLCLNEQNVDQDSLMEIKNYFNGLGVRFQQPPPLLFSRFNVLEELDFWINSTPNVTCNDILNTVNQYDQISFKVDLNLLTSELKNQSTKKFSDFLKDYSGSLKPDCYLLLLVALHFV